MDKNLSLHKRIFNKKNLKSILMINVGVFLCAISVTFFLSPNNIAGGGLSGVAILVEGFLPSFLNISSFIFICNTFLLTLSLILMGKEYFVKTCCGALIYPFYISFLRYLMGFLPEETFDFSEHMYLAVIFGAIFMALGIGIAMRNGGTTGGGDIVQSIMFKYFHVPYSKTMYIIEGIILFFGLFIYEDFPLTLLTVIYILLTGVILDNVVFAGFNKRAVYVISDKHEEIRNLIINDFVRGVTKLNGMGGYLNTEKPVLLCVLSSKEYFELRAHLEKIDPFAFTLVMKTTEVRGEGFSHVSQARLNAKVEKKIKKQTN